MEHKKISPGNQLISWVEQFVVSISSLKRKTSWIYRHTMLEFILYVEKTSGKENFLPAAVKQKTISGWLKEVKADHSLDTLLKGARILTRFFSFLEKRGILKKNPLDRLRKEYPKEGLKGIVLALVGSSSQRSLQALKVSPRFASPLGHHMQKFIALGRAIGKIYREEEYVLWRFDRFLRSYSHPPGRLSDSILKRWVSLFSKYSPKYRYDNFQIVRRFCIYLRRFDPTAYVPTPSLSPHLSSQFLPYIYSRAEIVTLLKSTRELKPTTKSPLRPHMFYVVILLLYTTGMRIGEVLKLRFSDINRRDKTLYICKTKFFKTRAIPLSSSMMQELEDYLELHKRAGMSNSPDSYLFHNPFRERPYAITTIQQPFRDMLRRLELKPPRGRSGPRLHDLRATFAVHRLERWYQQVIDVQSGLGVLSTYLGHTNISGTQQYLPMTTELLQQASQRFKKYFKSKQKGEKKDEK